MSAAVVKGWAVDVLARAYYQDIYGLEYWPAVTVRFVWKGFKSA